MRLIFRANNIQMIIIIIFVGSKITISTTVAIVFSIISNLYSGFT